MRSYPKHHKPGHNANISPKSSGLPVGTKCGYLLTVNMNFFLRFRLEQTEGTLVLPGPQGAKHSGPAGRHASAGVGNPEPRLGSPSPSPKGTRSSFPAGKHASSTPMH